MGQNRSLSAIGWGALLILVLVGAAQQCLVPVNHDAAWHLYAASAALDGERLYVDLLEFNPPLIYGLSAIPVWLGRVTGTSDILLFKASVLLLAIAITILSHRLIVIACPMFPIPTLTALTVLFLYLGSIRVAEDFGQREHLFFLLTFPYLLLALSRLRQIKVSPYLTVLVGGAALVGFGLKPQFLLLFGVSELFLWVWGATPLWRRPEVWMVTGGAAIHVGVTIVFFPEYFQVLGWATESYAVMQRSPTRVVKALLGLTLAAPLSVLLVRPSRRLQPAWKLGFVCYLALLALAVLPLKGWSYHFYPLRALSVMLAAAILLTAWHWRGPVGDAIDSGALGRVFVVALVVVALGEGMRTVAHRLNRWESTPTAQLIKTVEANSRGEGLLILDTSLYPTFPVVNYTNSTWSSSFPFLWPLPGLYPDAAGKEFSARPASERSEMEEWLLEKVTTDLQRDRPGLVFVRTVGIVGFEETSFDFIRYFSADPRFRNAWEQYRLRGVADSYRVYTRDDGLSGQ